MILLRTARRVPKDYPELACHHVHGIELLWHVEQKRFHSTLCAHICAFRGVSMMHKLIGARSAKIYYCAVAKVSGRQTTKLPFVLCGAFYAVSTLSGTLHTIVRRAVL